MKVMTIAAVALLLAGCETAPNTPGAGAGMAYTPVIDMQGVDGARYSNDLSACRQYAASIDVGRETMAGAVAGAVFAGALTAILGGNMRSIDQNASAGGFAGLSAQGDKAVGRQQKIVSNCMASRGYRVLDGTAQVSFSQSAAPIAPAAPPAASLALSPTQQPAAPQPATASTVAAVAPAQRATGQFELDALRVVEQARCATKAAPISLVTKGPGAETYSAACANGDTLIVRCDFGNCRALR